MKVDPLVKITDPDIVFPNGLPEKLVPAVKLEPELNVIPAASAASNLWAAPAKVIEPLIEAVAPADKDNDNAVAPEMFNWEPEATKRSFSAPPAMVRVPATPA